MISYPEDSKACRPAPSQEKQNTGYGHRVLVTARHNPHGEAFTVKPQRRGPQQQARADEGRLQCASQGSKSSFQIRRDEIAPTY